MEVLQMKKYFISVLLLFSLCSKQEGYNCVNCMSVAFRIQLLDSRDGSLIRNATIIAINQSKHDTIIVDSSYMAQRAVFDSAVEYVIWGAPGSYSLEIHHTAYDTFYQSGLTVTQWSEVTCEHANTENLFIRLYKSALAKRQHQKSGEIITQLRQGHC